jgi:transmembrane protein EpsG
MVNLMIYSLVVILAVNIASFNNYIMRFKSSNDLKKNDNTPIINIFLITIILSLYTAYLDTSGYLSADPARYAWSFLYRYPAYYESLTIMLNSDTEIGFLLLNMLVGMFTSDPYWLFFIIAFITTFINLYTGYKFSKRYTLIVFLYLISLYYFNTVYTLRQTLAISFGNLALLSYLKDLKVRYFLFTAVAFSFHTTSFILVPLYFILKMIKSTKAYVNIGIISILILFLFGPIFNTLLPQIPFVGEQLTNSYDEFSLGGGTIAIILKGLPFYFLTILAIMKRDKLTKIMNKADLYITCSVFYSISWLFSYNMYWLFRMSWYFILPSLALVPFLFSTIKSPKERILYYLVFFFLLIAITYRQIFITLR